MQILRTKKVNTRVVIRQYDEINNIDIGHYFKLGRNIITYYRYESQKLWQGPGQPLKMRLKAGPLFFGRDFIKMLADVTSL